MTLNDLQWSFVLNSVLAIFCLYLQVLVLKPETSVIVLIVASVLKRQLFGWISYTTIIGLTKHGINRLQYCSHHKYTQDSRRSQFWIFETDRFTIRPTSAVSEKPMLLWLMKHRIDRQAGNKVMAILVYPRWPPSAIFEFRKSSFMIGSAIPENLTAEQI